MAMYGYDTSTRVCPLFYHHHHYSDASHGPPNDDDDVSQHQGSGEGWVPKQREQQQQRQQQRLQQQAVHPSPLFFKKNIFSFFTSSHSIPLHFSNTILYIVVIINFVIL